MNHIDIADRILEWLDSANWPVNYNEDKNKLYLSLESGETGLVARIQVLIWDKGWFHVYAIWPDEISSNLDEIVKYVNERGIMNFDYGRMKVSTEDKSLYYQANVHFNNISELTDELLEETILGTALCMTEDYGPDIVEILEK